MIHKLSGKIAEWIIKYAPTVSERKEVLVYGCNTALYTLLSTLGLLLIGFVCRKSAESATFIGVFYLNQTIGGGVHANTHLKCFLIMTVYLLMALMIVEIEVTPNKCILLIGIVLCALYQLPVVLHKNKQYLSSHIRRLESISKRTLIIEEVGCVIIWMIRPAILPMITAGLCIACLSRVLALLMIRLSSERC